MLKKKPEIISEFFRLVLFSTEPEAETDLRSQVDSPWKCGIWRHLHGLLALQFSNFVLQPYLSPNSSI